MTCRNGNRGVEAPSSLLLYCQSMNHAYKGGVKVEFQILLEYLEYSLGIEGYHRILRTVRDYFLKVLLVISCQVPAAYALFFILLLIFSSPPPFKACKTLCLTSLWFLDYVIRQKSTQLRNHLALKSHCGLAALGPTATASRTMIVHIIFNSILAQYHPCFLTEMDELQSSGRTSLHFNLSEPW